MYDGEAPATAGLSQGYWRVAAVATRSYAVFRRGGAMFSNLWAVTSFISWATKAGHRPVIDFQTSEPLNRKTHPAQSDAWTDYFAPISEVDLDSVLARDDTVYFQGRPGEFPVHEYSQHAGYRAVFDRHIRLNEVMAAYVGQWQGFLSGHGVALGVHARGTDMKIARSHQAPPELHQLFFMVDHALELRNFDCIFLASEDEKSFSAFVRRYGTRLVTSDSFRTKHRKKLSQMDSSVLEWRYVLGMQVLRDAWLLSSCTGLVSGSSNVSEHAQVIKGEPYDVNLQIRRPRVDIIPGGLGAIQVTNALRYWTSSRIRGGPDFRVVDRSRGAD